MTKLSKPVFIAAILLHVLRVREEGSKMFPSVRIAQNLLETGGKIHTWNNLGGIKVGSGKPNAYWRGGVVNKGTWEVYNGKTVNITAAFRAYDTLYDFYKDQDLLFNLSRYARVREAKSPRDQARMLQACGYATDPDYAKKIISIINSDNLEKYDSEEEQPMTAAELKAFNVMRDDVAAIKLLLESSTKLVTAPKWFITEFGSADLDGKIHDPRFTAEGWRELAVSLRV